MHVESNEVHRNEVRSVYLVAYSDANLPKHPQRADFVDAANRAFTYGSANFKRLVL